jgi:hypothetical protein
MPAPTPTHRPAWRVPAVTTDDPGLAGAYRYLPIDHIQAIADFIQGTLA